MNDILIIGANGGLGQAFMAVFADKRPVGITREELDITNESEVSKVIAKYSPRLVINCAAYNDVDQAEEDRAFAENVNGYASGFLAHAATGSRATIIHFSTGQVFDGTNKEGYNEDAIPKPINAYGASKLLGEKEIKKNSECFYIIRTSWLFGIPKNGKKSFVDLMLEKSKTDDIVKVVEDEFGSPTYAKDLAQATRALYEERKPFGIYHLVNSGSVSRYEWAKEIFRLKKIKTKLSPIHSIDLQRVAARPEYEILNNTKYIQLRPWTEALQEFLKP